MLEQSLKDLGVVAGGVIAAMIAVTTVRPDNKSNYKDGHRGTDPSAVWNWLPEPGADIAGTGLS